ncbi:putative DsbA family dithiol-disulfide isomerase [Stackebrandtia albiflava]|uniref:Putative DsbA family dithiol-disulfide isomerase n=1 Tax=Stackebrandtia albiflava TaxID=406432 RepID=A0A562V0W7_9ACTN|nr:DsbA family oxidoreductase [Stackebrandtia albiflava]TWJ11485.1 putative DsbA family dithiol-disulfide isomerase [Stackebrandtia albiflava]
MTAPLKVDIWSDIACPWCYIGKRRFEDGVERYRANGGDAAVEVEYHSFELAPDTPVDFDGSEVDFLAEHKGMPAAAVKGMLQQVTDIAASVGLHYDFDALRHTKTYRAHQVLHLAKAHGRQAELKERFLKAYFEEGRHLGRDSELIALAAEVGLDPELVRAALAEDAHRDDVAADIAQARAYGISGVPFFVIDEKFGVSGAQEPQVFAAALEQAAAARGDAS